MSGLTQPDRRVRRMLLHATLGMVAARLVAARPAVAADASAAAVTIDNFTFQPKLLHVKPGTTVTWSNHDDIPHSIVLPQLGVHSPAIDTDGMFAHRFDQAGVYDYACGLHPFMRGQVVVAA